MDQSGVPAPAAAAASAPEAVVTADFVTRLIAYVIDLVVIGVATWIVNAILGNLGFIGLVLTLVVDIAISAGYFIYLWTNRRATLGMQVMKLQVLRADDGGTLAQDQAIRRWLYLGLPSILSLAFAPLAGLAGLGAQGALAAAALVLLLSPIVLIVSIAWMAWLAYQTNKDPDGQGPHDKAAASVVVKLTA